MTVVTVMKEVTVVNIVTLGDSIDKNYRSNSVDMRGTVLTALIVLMVVRVVKK